MDPLYRGCDTDNMSCISITGKQGKVRYFYKKDSWSSICFLGHPNFKSYIFRAKHFPKITSLSAAFVPIHGDSQDRIRCPWESDVIY